MNKDKAEKFLQQLNWKIESYEKRLNQEMESLKIE